MEIKFKAKTQKLPIYFTGNLYGEVENFAKIATILRQKKKEGEEFLLFDAGDATAGNPGIELVKGKHIAELMGITGFTAVTLGEKDFIYGPAVLKRNLSLIKAPAVAANIYIKELEQDLQPYIILDFQGIKVGITGLVTEEVMAKLYPRSGEKTYQEIKFIPYREALLEVLKTFSAKGVEIIILLSHLGLEIDQMLACDFIKINLIISGHTGEVLKSPAKIGNTLVVTPGEKAFYLGFIELEIETTMEIKS